MSTGFYRAFEDRHRGSRETILERLKVYLPFVHAVAQADPEAPFIDVGCGRGEWLQLLQAEGVRALGVDLDDGMLAACRERGLQAEQGDAIGFLRGRADASAAGVSGFHIAEHLSFADLDALVSEALRVLKPGGILILETPNPENLFVATSSFYLDPTHVRPLPPMLLSFLAEHKGFASVQVLRLQESAQLAARAGADLIDVLGGASPDYSVVAQKGGADAAAALPQLPARELGVSSEALALRFDRQQREDRALVAELRENAPQYDRLLKDFRRRLDWLESVALEAHHAATVTSKIAQESQAELRAVYASTSWRISAPLRWVGAVPRRYLPGAVRFGSRLAQRLGIYGFVRRMYWRARGRDITEPPPPPPLPLPPEHSETEHELLQRLDARRPPGRPD